MKKIIIFIGIIFLSLSLQAFTNAASMGLADSYSLRATGIEAGYWNPANLYNNETNGYQLYLINTGVSLYSNLFSVNLYNDINGDSLTISKRKDILSKFNKSLDFKADFRYSVFGYSFNQNVVSTGITTTVVGKLSKKYLELLFLGNTEHYDDGYAFTKKNNDLRVLSYADLTYSSSSKTLSDMIPNLDYVKWLPEINFGYAVSGLVGIAEADISKYDSHFSTNDSTGIHLDQKIKGRYGLGGYGMKVKLGFSSEVYENLKVGVTFDNLIGFIKWFGKTEAAEFSVCADSIFISDLGDDILTQTDTTYSIGNYETTLPVIFHLAALYKYEKASFSFDWNQNLKSGIVYKTDPEISIGTEYFALPYLPLRMGLGFGNNSRNYKMTYGIGYESKKFNIDLGLESVSQIIPSSTSKNISFGITSKLKW